MGAALVRNDLACPQGLEMKGERFGTSTKISKKKEPKAEKLGFERPRGQFPLIVPTQRGVDVAPVQCASHGQALSQCFHEAVERVCFPWSGVRAVLSRSSRAGVLTMVRRACSVITKQSGVCPYHGHACAQRQGEADERGCYAGI